MGQNRIENNLKPFSVVQVSTLFRHLGSRNSIFFMFLYFQKIPKSSIDKISSLSCQKVADSITSSKMGNNIAKQASVLLRSIPEYIRRYPSAYCTI